MKADRARVSHLASWFLAAGLALGCACNSASRGATESSRTPSSKPPVVAAKPAETSPRPQGDPQPTLPMGTVDLEVENRQRVTLKVEVASTPSQQQVGLMFREKLAEGTGMLFVFPRPRHQSFWMRNTLVPLDMFFIDSNFRVVGVVENAPPLTDDPREVAGDSQYVLEVNAGFAKAHGFGPGTKVRYLPPEGL